MADDGVGKKGAPTDFERLAALAVVASRLKIWQEACASFRVRNIGVDDEDHWFLKKLALDFDRANLGYERRFGRSRYDDPDWERMLSAVSWPDGFGSASGEEAE